MQVTRSQVPGIRTWMSLVVAESLYYCSWHTWFPKKTSLSHQKVCPAQEEQSTRERAPTEARYSTHLQGKGHREPPVTVWLVTLKLAGGGRWGGSRAQPLPGSPPFSELMQTCWGSCLLRKRASRTSHICPTQIALSAKRNKDLKERVPRRSSINIL